MDARALLQQTGDALLLSSGDPLESLLQEAESQWREELVDNRQVGTYLMDDQGRSVRIAFSREEPPP